MNLMCSRKKLKRTKTVPF